jgi:hypothetical protein
MRNHAAEWSEGGEAGDPRQALQQSRRQEQDEQGDQPDSLYRHYLTKSLHFFAREMARTSSQDSIPAEADVLCAELHRRLGHFDLAAEHLTRAETRPAFNDSADLAKVIAYQRMLVSLQDSGPHEVP